MNALKRAILLSLGCVTAATAADRETIGPLLIETLPNAGAGVWRIVHKDPVWCNSLLVETTDGTLVLCDTPMTEAATIVLLNWAEQRFGKRHWIVVNGHFHPDCMAGNAAMIDAGATVVASSHTAALIDSRAQTFLDDLVRQQADDPSLADEFRATRVAAPTQTFDETQTLVLPVDGERIVVSFLGAAHSPDNVVTFFEDRSLLFAGCLCFSAHRDRPGFVGDADLDEWPDTIRRVQALGAGIVIPGHGDPGGPELLDHTLDALRRYTKSEESGR